MRKLLDRMFKNKVLSFVIPGIMALLMYGLFLLFGTAEDKKNVLMAAPIVSLIWFFGVFGVVLFQVKNTSCPEWFLNVFELVAAIGFAAYAVMGSISFFVSGFQHFNMGICLGFVTYSAIALAHGKRNQQ